MRPCLILIDEWVAYLRQIYKVEGLPSGSFDANLSFVQSLTEAVKASPGTLLVASLPASQIEVGGEGGQEALARLKQTFSRVESSWRPASQEESYEIVRRRLFKEIPGDKFHHRDNTLKQFAKLYRENANDFPQGCADEDYRRKLEKAYPIHPGAVRPALYELGIAREIPAHARRAAPDGAGHPRALDGQRSLGDDHAGQRRDQLGAGRAGAAALSRRQLAIDHRRRRRWRDVDALQDRSVGPEPEPLLGDPSRCAGDLHGNGADARQENKGLDDKQINLGVVQPGERPAIFGDALRRLTNQAKFMHSDLGRYWYSMSASLNRIAADRAAQFEEALVLHDDRQGARQLHQRPCGSRPFRRRAGRAGISADVPDEAGGVRAVVLGVAHPHTGRDGSEALAEAKDILMQRGSTPRVYRNMLVFLAAEAAPARQSERRRSARPWPGPRSSARPSVST